MISRKIIRLYRLETNYYCQPFEENLHSRKKNFNIFEFPTVNFVFIIFLFILILNMNATKELTMDKDGQLWLACHTALNYLIKSLGLGGNILLFLVYFHGRRLRQLSVSVYIQSMAFAICLHSISKHNGLARVGDHSRSLPCDFIFDSISVP